MPLDVVGPVLRERRTREKRESGRGRPACLPREGARCPRAPRSRRHARRTGRAECRPARQTQDRAPRRKSARGRYRALSAAARFPACVSLGAPRPPLRWQTPAPPRGPPTPARPSRPGSSSHSPAFARNTVTLCPPTRWCPSPATGARRGSRRVHRTEAPTFMFPRRRVLSTTRSFFTRSLSGGEKGQKQRWHLDPDRRGRRP